MKIRNILAAAVAAACLWGASPAQAQLNVGRIAKGVGKAAQAVTLTDAQMTAYVKEYIDWMDEHNPVLPADDPYT
ncbi:MAG: peptidase, partial [Muribaculaceae bacterium]|nr:peptidase [Muribaculaceae bacterium]